jgi:hypothetical protein
MVKEAIEKKITEAYHQVFGESVDCSEQGSTWETPVKEWKTTGKIPVRLVLELHDVFAYDPGIVLNIYPDHMGGGEGLTCGTWDGWYWCDDSPGYIPSDRLQWEQFTQLVWQFFRSLTPEQLKPLYDEATVAAQGRKAIADKYYAANPHLMRYWPDPDEYTEEEFYDQCFKYLEQKLKTKGIG